MPGLPYNDLSWIQSGEDVAGSAASDSSGVSNRLGRQLLANQKAAFFGNYTTAELVALDLSALPIGANGGDSTTGAHVHVDLEPVAVGVSEAKLRYTGLEFETVAAMEVWHTAIGAKVSATQTVKVRGVNFEWTASAMVYADSKPLSLKAFGGKGDDTFRSPSNDDSDAFEAALRWSAEGMYPVLLDGVYTITRKPLAADGNPIQRFNLTGLIDEKRHQFAEEDGFDRWHVSCLQINLSSITDNTTAAWGIDIVDDRSGIRPYGPYIRENFVVCCVKGGFMRVGGLVSGTNYNPDNVGAAFVVGGRTRNVYITGAIGNAQSSFLDASDELLNFETVQVLDQWVRGYECVWENCAYRGGLIGLDIYAMDNPRVERTRSSLSWIPYRLRSQVQGHGVNIQVEGKSFLHGVQARHMQLSNCRLENGYAGDIGWYRATHSGTHVSWAVASAGVQHINFAGLNGNDVSAYFYKGMILKLVGSGGLEFLVQVDEVDDVNDRVSFVNYDSYCRFNKAESGTEVYRGIGANALLEKGAAMLDGSWGFNSPPTVTNFPLAFISPGDRPIQVANLTDPSGPSNNMGNRPQVVAFSVGTQFRLNFPIYTGGCAPFLSPDPLHPLVCLGQMQTENFNNTRGWETHEDYQVNRSWLMSAGSRIAAVGSSTSCYFFKEGEFWALYHDNAAPTTEPYFEVSEPAPPNSGAIYKFEILAKSVSGETTLQPVANSETPFAGTSLGEVKVGAEWTKLTRYIADAGLTAWNNATARKYVVFQGTADFWLAWARLTRVDAYGDSFQDQFTLAARYGSADLTDVGEVFDVVEETATFQVTYNSVAYTNGQAITVVDGQTTATLNTGTGYLLNQRRKFTPARPGYLVVFAREGTNVELDHSVYRIQKSDRWMINAVVRNQVSATRGAPATIDSLTGEVTIGTDYILNHKVLAAYAYVQDFEAAMTLTGI